MLAKVVRRNELTSLYSLLSSSDSSSLRVRLVGRLRYSQFRDIFKPLLLLLQSHPTQSDILQLQAAQPQGQRMRSATVSLRAGRLLLPAGAAGCRLALGARLGLEVPPQPRRQHELELAAARHDDRLDRPVPLARHLARLHLAHELEALHHLAKHHVLAVEVRRLF